MSRILALQCLNVIGPDVSAGLDEKVMASTCSYVECGGCSTPSMYSCQPAPVMIVSI